MPTRRQLLTYLSGGMWVTALGPAAGRPPRAAQRKCDPTCPTCGSIFGLVADPSLRAGEQQQQSNGQCLVVALCDLFEPGKAWPVRCQCGWSGTAVFYEAQEA